MIPPSPVAQKNSLNPVVRFLGAAVGVAVGQYAGINLLIPLFATALIWWGGSKILRDGSKVILAAFSVNAGHFLWLSLGLWLVRPAPVIAIGPDLAVYAIGLTWLYCKPSAGPLYLLGTYQLLSLGVNAHSFAHATVGSVQHAALLVHLIWRAMALFLVIKLLLTLRKQRRSEPSKAE
jgi:hypothetical protein